MKFDLLYELQTPKPHDERSEYRAYHEALEQIELADRLGFDTVWAVVQVSRWRRWAVGGARWAAPCAAPRVTSAACAGRRRGGSSRRSASGSR